MWKPSLSRSALILLSGSLAFVSVACSNDETKSASTPSPTASQPATSTAATPTPPITPKPSVSPSVSPSTPKPDTYEQALDTATSAQTIAKSAESQDDWKLVSSRWDEAIKLFGEIPASSPNKAKAQKKLKEFEREVTYAKLKATPPAEKVVNLPQPIRTTQLFFRAPIKYRVHGIPVIDVIFNGGQKFEMLFDTGASGTLITPPMANALSLQAIGTSKHLTANGEVDFFVGVVKSMQVGGAVVKNLPVSVGGPDLDLGLFGQDFYKGYDVSVKQNVIEFTRRKGV